jgi:hypothetical protein
MQALLQEKVRLKQALRDPGLGEDDEDRSKKRPA